MKSKKLLAVVLLAVSILVACTACSNGSEKAKAALEGYLQCIVDKDYEAAYDYLSDFDKENFSKELFVNWRTDIAKIQTFKSFEISGKVDKFKNYKYLGTTLGNAFGFEVRNELEQHIDGFTPTGYDAESYPILVISDGDNSKVALLLTDLEESYAKLHSKLAEKENAAK